MSRRLLASAACALLLLGTAPHRHPAYTGSFRIDAPAGAIVGGSRLPLQTAGVQGPVSFSVLGPGHLDGNVYVAPVVQRKTTATLIGSARGAVAMRSVEIVPPPKPWQPLIAVATYQNGIALHDPRTFALIGYVPIGGAPGDVAFNARGELFAPATDGSVLAAVSRTPWAFRGIPGVPLGNEVAVDDADGAVLVTNRDAGGFGALTRIMPDGSVTRVKTGNVAEGLAIDAKRAIAYVGDVDRGAIAVVDIARMRVLATIPSVRRTFGMALDARANTLFVVSNVSPSMPEHGGYVAAIDVRARKPHVTRRSARMTFPLGAALDGIRHRVLVTDEARNVVYVLSEKTLRAVHAPLQTCRTPWRPLVFGERLYVPCADSNQVDVFDLHSLRRVPGAPFATGGYPLGVAEWK